MTGELLGEAKRRTCWAIVWVGVLLALSLFALVSTLVAGLGEEAGQWGFVAVVTGFLGMATFFDALLLVVVLAVFSLSLRRTEAAYTRPTFDGIGWLWSVLAVVVTLLIGIVLKGGEPVLWAWVTAVTVFAIHHAWASRLWPSGMAALAGFSVLGVFELFKRLGIGAEGGDTDSPGWVARIVGYLGNPLGGFAALLAAFLVAVLIVVVVRVILQSGESEGAVNAGPILTP